MIANVPLRLFYLIFNRLLGWLLLLAAHRLPKTSSCSSEVVPKLMELEVAVPHLKPASR
jgi:hypothetical protein